MAIATGVVALMYVGICYSIAEMASALPHTGGAYSFGRTAMGPWGGLIAGLAQTMEYVLTPAVIVIGIGGYIGEVFDNIFSVEAPAPLWWLVFYVLFVGINILGMKATFRFCIVFTVLALAILLVFWIGAIPHFSWDIALNIDPAGGGSRFLPYGWRGIAEALPFAIWFYLAIEEIPLAAEESRNPQRDMPKALIWGILALIATSLLTLFLNAGITPGAAGIGKSEEPLIEAFKTIFGVGGGTTALALFAVAGLVASFLTIIYAYSRNIYSLSRSGYFPKWLSVTLTKRRTPHAALISGAVIGYGVALLIEYGDDWLGTGGGWLGVRANVQAATVLLNMAAIGAVIAYIMQMIAFVRLRRSFPAVERPYVSPLGNAGAIVAAVIALVALCFMILNPDYRIGVIGCAIWFAVGLGYFALSGRKNLVYSPEERFALEHSAHPRAESADA